MASLVLGAAGAAVGSFFGGSLGASIGWAIGSGVGNALFAPTQYGPKLSDLHLSVSSYGAAISILYGRVRTSGNVIWSTDLIQEDHKNSGKGGPTSITYSYKCSWAVQLCQTSYIDGNGTLVNAPISGIRRIWADGHLIWDASKPSSSHVTFVLYTGTEDQLPDPTIEAVEGVGNVSAHRGYAYVVFAHTDMDQFGDHMPNLEFEVVASPTTGTPSFSYYSHFEADFLYGSVTVGEGGRYLSWPLTLTAIPADGGVTITSYRCGDNTTYPHIANGSYQFESRTFTLKGVQTGQSSFSGSVSNYTTSWGQFVSLNSNFAYVFGDSQFYCQNCLPNGNQEILFTWSWMTEGGLGTGPSACSVCSGSGANLGIEGSSVRIGNRLWAAMNDGKPFVGSFAIDTITNSIWDLGPSETQRVGLTGITPENSIQLCYGDDGFLYIYCENSIATVDYPNQGGHLLKVDVSGELPVILNHWTPSQWAPPATTVALNMFGDFWVRDGYLIFCSGQVVVGSGPTAIYNYLAYKLEDNNSITLAAWVATGSLVSGADSLSHQVPGAAVSIGNGYAAVRDGILSFQGPGDGGVLWRDIVSDLSRRCAMETGDYDTSAVPYYVRGYAIGRQMQGRAAIEPLMQGYFVDAVESDTAVKYIPRGGASVVTIPDADLGAHASGSPLVAPFFSTRQDEIVLPEILNVNYRNRDADYLANTQIGRRYTTASRLETTLDLPLVFTDDEAKSIADKSLWTAWYERERQQIATTQKYAKYEPTDVITLSRGTYRILQKREVQSGAIVFDCVLSSNAVLLQAAVPAPPIGQPPTTTTPSQATLLLPLDIPLVTDNDFTNGYPTLMQPAQQFPWAGATIFKSVDGGSNFSTLLTSTGPDIFGVATTKLADWAGGNVIDEVSSVTVQLGIAGGTLASTTYAGLLNNANMALVGYELIQYRDATLVSAGIYKLTGLLRGRRGTEWAQVSHAIGERFTVLPAINATAGPSSELGQSIILNATTGGNTLSPASNVAFTNNGMTLRPYALIALGGGPNGAGDVTLNWTRRTRIGGKWVDLTEVPVSEAMAWYVLEIWDSTYQLCARTGDCPPPPAVYTSAYQVTDFGAQQKNIYFTVAQVGARGIGQRTRGVAKGLGASDTEPLAPVPYYGYPSAVRPPPSGSGCAFDATLTSPAVVSLDPFVVGQRWVGKFTTPAGVFGGRIVFSAASGGAAVYRMGWLATDTCGVAVVANSTVVGDAPVLDFGTTGIAACVVLPSTVYYFIAEFNDISGPVGTSAKSTVRYNIY